MDRAVPSPDGTVDCPLLESPQHATVPSVRIATTWYRPRAIAVAVPSEDGTVAWPYELLPQTRTWPFSRIAAELKRCAATAIDAPRSAGTALWPSLFVPHARTSPPRPRATVWRWPAATASTGPRLAGMAICPSPAYPQARISRRTGSWSQTSPVPSPSQSDCAWLLTSGQLSVPSGSVSLSSSASTLLPMPSASVSADSDGSYGNASCASVTPSLSSSGSSQSPVPSASASLAQLTGRYMNSTRQMLFEQFGSVLGPVSAVRSTWPSAIIPLNADALSDRVRDWVEQSGPRRSGSATPSTDTRTNSEPLLLPKSAIAVATTLTGPAACGKPVAASVAVAVPPLGTSCCVPDDGHGHPPHPAVPATVGQRSAPSAMPSLSSSVSALLPVPSPSLSADSAGSSGNASVASGTPSLSSSGSHGSPAPSPSASSWPALAADGQLSFASGSPSASSSASALSPMPSPSVSALSAGSSGNASLPSGTPSLSSSVSRQSAVPSASVSTDPPSGPHPPHELGGQPPHCALPGTAGQASAWSSTPSPSVSTAVTASTPWSVRLPVHVPTLPFAP